MVKLTRRSLLGWLAGAGAFVTAALHPPKPALSAPSRFCARCDGRDPRDEATSQRISDWTGLPPEDFNWLCPGCTKKVYSWAGRARMRIRDTEFDPNKETYRLRGNEIRAVVFNEYPNVPWRSR